MTIMNKASLIEKIATSASISKAQAESALNAFVEITVDAMKKGDTVTLTGFGAFSSRKRKGREGINPRNTKEKITIPSVLVAKFKAGKNLKEELKAATGGVPAPTNKEEQSESPSDDGEKTGE